jgi:hypothetical protein
MPIDGIRVSAFFTTHLTTDQPSVCNFLTNIAFAPIQQLIGQKNYQCLQGRVYELASAPQPPSSQLSSAWKVIVVIAAIFSTPCGILTRYLSFYASDITLGYWSALLLSIKAIQRPGFLTSVDSKLQEKIQAQLNALENQKVLDQHITSAITFLEKLEGQLFGPNPLKVKEWLNAASKKSDYPYPFELAEKLKNKPLRDIPNRDLLKQFENLHWNCHRKLEKLTSNSPTKEATTTVRQQIHAVLMQNDQFFTTLSNKMVDFRLSTENLASQLEEEEKSQNHSYPFYTQPLVLTALKQITPDYEALAIFEKNYTECIRMMKPNIPLIPFINKNPPADYPMITELKLAIGQLDNVCHIEALYNL